MRQKKRIWWTFQLWEADAFQQYLEEMAQQGWFLESVGGSVMKFYQAQPEKRRYAALLVPETSSLTGTDIAKAEQFREQCQEAGWNFQCSGTFWQIFYTTDEAAERTGKNSLSNPVCGQFLGGIHKSAESRKIICGSRAADSQSIAVGGKHFLDGVLCTVISMEPRK